MTNVLSDFANFEFLLGQELHTHRESSRGVQLPWRFRLGFNFAYASAPSLNAYVGRIDFNCDGTTDDLLPGGKLNAFNRSLGRADLARLVAQFNQIYAERTDAKGAAIPQLTLPVSYSL